MSFEEGFRLSTGRLVEVSPGGDVGMVFDRQGRADLPNFSASEISELRGMVSKALAERNHETASMAGDDPRFADVQEYAFATLTPEEQAILNTDPAAFNEWFRQAREEVGESEAEIQVEKDRKARIKEIEKKGFNELADVAEYLRLKGGR